MGIMRFYVLREIYAFYTLRNIITFCVKGVIYEIPYLSQPCINLLTSSSDYKTWTPLEVNLTVTEDGYCMSVMEQGKKIHYVLCGV